DSGDRREQGRPLLVDVRGVGHLVVLAERLRDADVLVDPGVLRRPGVQQRHRGVDGDDQREQERAKQPGSRPGAAELRHHADQQRGQAEEEPGVGAREHPVGPDRLPLDLAHPEGPQADPGHQQARLKGQDSPYWRSAQHGRPPRTSRAAHETTPITANAYSAGGCQAVSQIMAALTMAVAARLTTTVSPAWTSPSPLSTQHITAAPTGTQASRKAPARFGPRPGTASRTTAARLAP